MQPNLLKSYFISSCSATRFFVFLGFPGSSSENRKYVQRVASLVYLPQKYDNTTEIRHHRRNTTTPQKYDNTAETRQHRRNTKPPQKYDTTAEIRQHRRNTTPPQKYTTPPQKYDTTTEIRQHHIDTQLRESFAFRAPLITPIGSLYRSPDSVMGWDMPEHGVHQTSRSATSLYCRGGFWAQAQFLQYIVGTIAYNIKPLPVLSYFRFATSSVLIVYFGPFNV